MFYNLRKLEDTTSPTVHHSGSASDMTPERRLLYEVIFLFLGASPQHKNRKFSSSSLSVAEMKKNTKTEIRRDKLEAKTNEAPECSAGKLLNSLCHMIPSRAPVSTPNTISINAIDAMIPEQVCGLCHRTL